MEYKNVDEKLLVCKICGKKLQDMPRRKKNLYLFNIFKEHVESEHHITIEDYMLQFFNVQKQLCRCGCGNYTKLVCLHKQIVYRDYVIHHTFADKNFIKQNAEIMKITRKGENNPMFNRHAWNYGMTHETNEKLKKISDSMKNRIVSDSTREKLRIALLERRKNGFTGNKGNKHSEATKNLLKIITLRQIAEGKLKQTDTIPHQKVCLFLSENNIRYQKEKQMEYFSFDIFLIDYNIYIEVDGDYWHANPQFYSEKELTKSQKINIYRDSKKNEFATHRGLKLMRFWENDIMNHFDSVKQAILSEISKKANQGNINESK